MSAINPANIRQALSRRYEGDAQGFYAAECKLILKGKLPGPLSDDHLEAVIIENRAFLNSMMGNKAELGNQPF